MTNVELLFVLVQLLRVFPQWQHGVGQLLHDGEKVEEGGGLCARDLAKLLESLPVISAQRDSKCIQNILRYLIELDQFRVINADGPEAKHHLRGQRVGIPSDVVDKKIGLVQEAHEHLLVL